MYVLAIGNQKGGTAKTTSTAALAVLLSRRGRHVHLIDMDPQASLTAAFGQQEPEGLLYLALKQGTPLPVVRLTPTLTLTPSSIDLATGESEFIAATSREYLLKTCLEKTEAVGQGTAVIIDCPPSLGVLAINCLAAATALAVVVQPGGFELRALAHLERVVQLLRQRVNPGLAIIGGILTNCQRRPVINKQVQGEIGRLYTDLGLVRSDMAMLNATTEGAVAELRLSASNALQDYDAVLNKLVEVCPWLNAE
jgi:chromosome partitioning protein